MWPSRSSTCSHPWWAGRRAPWKQSESQQRAYVAARQYGSYVAQPAPGGGLACCKARLCLVRQRGLHIAMVLGERGQPRSRGGLEDSQGSPQRALAQPSGQLVLDLAVQVAEELDVGHAPGGAAVLHQGVEEGGLQRRVAAPHHPQPHVAAALPPAHTRRGGPGWAEDGLEPQGLRCRQPRSGPGAGAAGQAGGKGVMMHREREL